MSLNFELSLLSSRNIFKNSVYHSGEKVSRKKKIKKQKCSTNKFTEPSENKGNQINNTRETEIVIHDVDKAVIKKKYKQKENELRKNGVYDEKNNARETQTSSCIIQGKAKGKKLKNKHHDNESTQFSEDLSKKSNNDEEISAVIDKQEIRNKKKSKKRRQQKYIEDSEEQSYASYLNEEDEPAKKKKKRKYDEQEYKPGMLSNILHKKKYGSLVLPWDPSFGKDKIHPRSTSVQIERNQHPNIKINPLFDLSRRNQENNEEYRVFVGNLPQDITKLELKNIFKDCGSIDEIKVKNKQNKNFACDEKKGSWKNQPSYAILILDSLEKCEAALKINGELYKGHHLRIKMNKDPINNDTEKSIFIGNLSPNVKDDDLWKVFEICGDIDSVRVVRCYLSKKGSVGYVNFKIAESVNEALKLNGTILLDRKIRVTRSKSDAKSLSDSITVKRRKKKRKKKSQQDTNDEKSDVNKTSKFAQNFCKLNANSANEDSLSEQIFLKKKKKKHKKKIATITEKEDEDFSS